MFSVLIIEDESTYARALSKSLKKKSIQVSVEQTAADGLGKAKAEAFDVILLDNRLPDIFGLNMIGRLKAARPLASIIMMTAYGTVQDAVQAMRLGAEDYVLKTTSPAPIINKVLEINQRNEKRDEMKDKPKWSAEELLGECQEIGKVKQQLAEVSKSAETTVLLTGESGSGKEVAARNLHVNTGKPKDLFIPVDCLSLPTGLAESHLFGHEKGSFTGADRKHIGFFEVARDGMVFLDEIGDIDITIQGKLLRTIETRRLTRVGSTQQIPMKARVVLATNRDLTEMVRQGTFRADLYHRISVFPIHLPPLRERSRDILLLARHFMKYFSDRMQKRVEEIDEEAQKLMIGYEYPGNVRELKNIIERAVILTKGDHITEELLPERMLSPARSESFSGLKEKLGVEFVPGVDTIESVERKMIQKALDLSGGIKSKAAEMLGISRFQLLRRLEKYGERSDRET